MTWRWGPLSFCPLYIVHFWTPLMNFSFELLYTSAICLTLLVSFFSFWYFLNFLFLCWNSHFVHGLISWPSEHLYDVILNSLSGKLCKSPFNRVIFWRYIFPLFGKHFCVCFSLFFPSHLGLYFPVSLHVLLFLWLNFWIK